LLALHEEPEEDLAVFTPNTAISAARSRMPTSIAIRTIMIEALTEYSIQRA
jgi:hypothetical protein